MGNFQKMTRRIELRCRRFRCERRRLYPGRRDCDRRARSSWCAVRSSRSRGRPVRCRSKWAAAWPRNWFGNRAAVSACRPSSLSNWSSSTRPVNTNPWNIPGKTGTLLYVSHQSLMPLKQIKIQIEWAMTSVDSLSFQLLRFRHFRFSYTILSNILNKFGLRVVRYWVNRSKSVTKRFTERKREKLMKILRYLTLCFNLFSYLVSIITFFALLYSCHDNHTWHSLYNI